MSEAEAMNIMEVLREIQQKLEAASNPKIVVDVEEIGQMFGRKKGTGYRLIKMPGFPAPIHEPGVVGRVWLKEDVQKWARSRQIRNERMLAA